MKPPWSYKVYSDKGKGRSAENHYSTMTINDIKNIRVNDISDKNSVLILWVTSPCLPEGLEVMKAWGFKYKTVLFTWAKLNKHYKTNCNTKEEFEKQFRMNLGFYTRCLGGETEITLLDIEKDIFFVDNIKNLRNYDITKYKIWSYNGWKNIINFIENKGTKVNKIVTPVGELLCSDEHQWIYKRPIYKYIDRKKNKRKISHEIVQNTTKVLIKHFNSSAVIKHGYSVNLLYSETPIECLNPITELLGFKLTDEMAYIIGLFCAEGNYGKKSSQNQIRFSLHAKEIDKYEFIKKYMESLNLKGDRYFNYPIVVRNFIKENRLSVYFSKKSIKDLFQQFIINEGACLKRLNLELLYKTSVSFRQNFYKGMFEGDGCMIKGKYPRIALCNKELIKDFQKLLFSLGVMSLYKEQKPQYRNKTLCYKYMLQIYNRNRAQSLEFNNVSVRTMQIDNIISEYSVETTYDIEVEDSLFNANGLITHNSNVEFCLLGTKGKPLTRLSKSIRQLVIEPMEEHSKKPDIIKTKIVELFGDLPKIELFARTCDDNWTCIGNEITGNDINADINKLINN